jgi:hypothetical protein
MQTQFPGKNSNPTAQSVKQLDDALTALIAGHPGSVELWTFYEEVDAYLGPWGDEGYPIGYGKYYCKLFNDNPKLAADPQGTQWVKKTTVALQQALKDVIVTRYRNGTLSSLTQQELRIAAFASHPAAYTDSGLAMVALIAPDLLPVIMSIPGKEFSPFAKDFTATVEQFVKTMAMTLPSAAGITLAAAMPAHSGLLRTAAARDRMESTRELNTVRWLSDTESLLRSGRFDNVSALVQITDRLKGTQFGNQVLAQRARQLIELANTRKRATAAYYRKLISDDPSLRSAVDRADPGWSNW